MKDRPVLFGSLTAGLLASACCIGPLILGAIGLGSVGLGAWLAPARPWFLALTALMLAIGFYLAYRPLRESACEPGQACAPSRSRRSQRLMLWGVTLVTAALATYPSWGARPGGGQSLAAGRDSSAAVVTLTVSGMTCDACAGEIEQSLRGVPGVVQASVDYEQSRAEIILGEASINSDVLIAAVERTGYRATVGSSDRSGASDTVTGLVGQWRGKLVVDEEGETSDLIVDIDRVAGRWTGQFDLPGFGVEDYPVDVTLAGRVVTLHLSAAQVEFIGELTKNGFLAGISETRGHRDSLALRRVGSAQLSDEFLRLEALAEDSTRVESLSASGAELRRQFNQDRGFTRLLMLLSPT